MDESKTGNLNPFILLFISLSENTVLSGFKVERENEKYCLLDF